MYTTIIFDFFDVIRTDPYNAWLKRHKIDRSDDYVAAAKHLDIGNIDVSGFSKWLERLSGQPAHTVLQEYASTRPVHPHIPAVIAQLKKGYKIGLLSNAPSMYLRQLLQEHNLERLFDTIVVSSEVGKVKPSKDIFQLILGELHAKSTEAIFIDDNPRNVAAAEEIGLTAIQFTGLQALLTDLKNLGVNVTPPVNE